MSEVKVFYPDGKVPRADKHHWAAVDTGEVELGCFLGGSMIEALKAHAPPLPGIGKDVCAACPIGDAHRKECTGRPQNKRVGDQKAVDSSALLRDVQNTNEGAYSLRRQSHLSVLDRLTGRKP